MKTIPLIPACQNMEELQKLTNLICEYVHPQMIILFGYYAGMTIGNVLKGYELLILTQEKPSVSYRALLQYLELHFHVADRREKNLGVYLYPLEFVKYKSVQSYFLTTIRQEGLLLYKSENCKLNERIRYKPIKALQQAEKSYQLAFELGQAFLDNARHNLESGSCRLTAFHLYQSALQFIRAVNFVYYGFVLEERENLLIAFSRVRYCSTELMQLWEGDKELAAWRLFGRLQSFDYQARFKEQFRIQENLLNRYVKQLQLLETVTEHFCTQRLKEMKILQKL